MSSESMTRWRLRVEYDGTGFAGWQLQPDRRTVQGVLEASLAAHLGHFVRVYSAGRTDAGVHALDQVVIFDSAARRKPTNILNALNVSLPDDVSIRHVEVVDPSFCPRRCRHRKQYRYRWLAGSPRSPTRHNRVWHFRKALDVERMQLAVVRLRGKHDFSAFRASGCSAKHAVRVVADARIEPRADEVHLVVEGNGFLRHMIRIMAGSLVEVGLGRREPEWISALIEGRDRTVAGRTAPPGGLCLRWVRYLDE